jgi:hypothetical protein
LVALPFILAQAGHEQQFSGIAQSGEGSLGRAVAATRASMPARHRGSTPPVIDAASVAVAQAEGIKVDHPLDPLSRSTL